MNAKEAFCSLVMTISIGSDEYGDNTRTMADIMGTEVECILDEIADRVASRLLERLDSRESLSVGALGKPRR